VVQFLTSWSFLKDVLGSNPTTVTEFLFNIWDYFVRQVGRVDGTHTLVGRWVGADGTHMSEGRLVWVGPTCTLVGVDQHGRRQGRTHMVGGQGGTHMAARSGGSGMTWMVG
jgi:hypothetical protein